MKKSYIQNTVITAVLFAAVFTATSCTSTPKEIPNDMTAREIVQQAQTAYDAGHITLAEQYYQTLLKRYGTDTAVYVEGNYEIAHIYMKQKKYKEAAPLLQEIISIYENSTPGTLPGAYHKLAENDLAKIPADKLPAVKADAADSSTAPETTAEEN
jgi:TolA-binding protein